jgi:hypothetical protein
MYPFGPYPQKISKVSVCGMSELFSTRGKLVADMKDSAE